MPELPHNQIPTPDQSFLLSTEDLAAKKAKWLQEGYTEAEADEMAKMFGRLSEIQDIYKDSLKPGEDWPDDPDEKAKFLEQAERFEQEKVEIGKRREEIKRSLAGREEPRSEVGQVGSPENLIEGLEGRDAEEFLAEVEAILLDYASKTESDIKEPDVWLFESYNDSSRFKFSLLGSTPINFSIKLIDVSKDSPEYTKTLSGKASFKGLDTLRRLLKGKKIIVVCESNLVANPPWREIYLQVVNPKKDDPKIFVFNVEPGQGRQSSVESTGVQELGGYKVGDRLKIKLEENWAKRGWLRHYKPAREDLRLQELKIAGFDRKGRVIVQMVAGGEAFVEPVEVVKGCYDHVPMDEPGEEIFTDLAGHKIEAGKRQEYLDYKVGDLFTVIKRGTRPYALTDHVEIREAKEIRLAGFTLYREGVILELNGDPNTVSVIDMAYMDCFDKIN